MMLCRQLHESWDFDLLRIIWTAASLLVFCCQSDWIPKRIIKGSFLQEIPHITLPPLNHICSAKSSSSTCSNFALEKTSLSLSFSSFLLLHFHPELTKRKSSVFEPQLFADDLQGPLRIVLCYLRIFWSDVQKNTEIQQRIVSDFTSFSPYNESAALFD